MDGGEQAKDEVEPAPPDHAGFKGVGVGWGDEQSGALLDRWQRPQRCSWHSVADAARACLFSLAECHFGATHERRYMDPFAHPTSRALANTSVARRLGSTCPSRLSLSFSASPTRPPVRSHANSRWLGIPRRLVHVAKLVS
ncbi:hypothetical protein L1887_47878 [Cichorium endivia]|nr:hypothetical protein L1887_47878 [Cichorium endivia]